MGVLQVRVFGDPVLRSKADPVAQFDDRLAKLGADMTETMHAAPGVGLAAPQVGVPRRLFVFDSAGESGALCNPEIVWRSEEEQTGEEGCLSIPSFYFPVTRAMSCRVRAQDLSGAPVELEGTELLARIFQHEIDHLDGILFIDRLGPDDRREALRMIREAELLGTPPPKAQGAPAL